jgi:hypothetical protein
MDQYAMDFGMLLVSASRAAIADRVTKCAYATHSKPWPIVAGALLRGVPVQPWRIKSAGASVMSQE